MHLTPFECFLLSVVILFLLAYIGICMCYWRNKRRNPEDMVKMSLVQAERGLNPPFANVAETESNVRGIVVMTVAFYHYIGAVAQNTAIVPMRNLLNNFGESVYQAAQDLLHATRTAEHPVIEHVGLLKTPPPKPQRQRCETQKLSSALSSSARPSLPPPAPPVALNTYRKLSFDDSICTRETLLSSHSTRSTRSTLDRGFSRATPSSWVTPPSRVAPPSRVTPPSRGSSLPDSRCPSQEQPRVEQPRRPVKEMAEILSRAMKEGNSREEHSHRIEQ